MGKREVAVKNAKIGYVAIMGMLIANLLLASFVFFNIELFGNREMFLAVGTFMALLYAITFPTKLLPSGSYLLRCIAFLIMPLIITELISTSYDGAVSIMAFVISVGISVFSAYITTSYQSKIIKYISEENYNDYVLFEYRTFKIQEVNIYALSFLFINFFIAMLTGSDVVLIVAVFINLLFGIFCNFYRTKAAKLERVKMVHFALESLATALAYVLVVIVNVLELSSFIYIAAIALMLPTLATTIVVFKDLDRFMYK